ncbi:MAG: hypothetical protein JXP34_01555 [Planctomycetes bacterium]|nr:hypothetical protein [Planctomycetota bacterium]
MLDLLEAPWQRKPAGEELDRAADGIRAAADRAIDVLRSGYDQREQEFAFRHRTVQILERLATPKARAFLLDIALGRTKGDNASQSEWASRAHVETLKDKVDARALLPSGDPGVLGNVLRALAESDPLERERGGCVRLPGEKDTYFPVREAAGSAMRAIEGRWPSPGRGGNRP